MLYGKVVFTEAAAKRLSHVLGNLNDAAANTLKQLSPADFKTVTESLGKLFYQDRVDHRLMLKVLNNLPNQFLTSPPKLVSLLSDMAGIVAVKGLKNAVEAIATIIDSTADAATKAKWIYGRLYEFRVASFLKQQGASVEFIQQFVKEAKELGLTSTDIDIVANGVYYQVKSSAGAFGTGKQALDDVIEWVKKAKRHGQVNGNANPSIKYVVPDRTMVPDNVKDWLLSESIDIIEITF